MTDLKTVLSPFRIPREIPSLSVATDPEPLVIEENQYVTRRTHPTRNDEFDMNFRIGTTTYNDNSYGSVSIRANSMRNHQSYFTCFLSRKELNQVIDTLIQARELAFPVGAKPYVGYED